MTLTVTLVFAAFFGLASCDYKCVCNYNVEKSVQTSPSVQSNVMGYMYEFDCKPQAGVSADADWLPVAYEHKLGYVEVDSQLQVQTCPGAVPDEDKLPTTSAPQTTTMPVTSEAQTTEPKPTAQTTSVVSTSQNPTTTQTTTMPTTSTTTEALTTESTTVTNPSTLPTTQVPTTKMMPTTASTTTTTVATTSATTRLPTSTTSTTTATTSIQSTSTLPTTTTTKLTTTTQQITTPKPSILKGHVELCPQRIQQLAAQSKGEHLAQFGQNCYEIVDSDVSWSHAESICKGDGGHLIHIANQQEQDFIFDFLVKHHTHTVWLGLHDRNIEESFEWTSGNAVTYENWKPGRKDYRYHNSEDCVFMTPTTGEWDDIQCGGDNGLSELIQGIRHAFICQYATVTPLNPLNPTIDGNINLCPHRLQLQAQRDNGTLAQHDQSCYELVSNEKVSWQHAEQICSSRGGHLVFITSSQEQNFIQSFMKSHFPDHAVWIGLTDRHTEGRFHWESGQYTHYTNWVPGHIANYASSSQEDCVVLIPYKNGQWDDIPCGYTHHSLFGGTSSSGETHPLLCEYSISTGPSLIG
ncbi:brevican core protein-like isoform X2 [Ruditapes philippinarum]|uniref:brevican core protein-like isoform X2 n=1 Tax=Ruditapes philippinarum TaxID=129788 RepID=UPI00295BFA1E|nr:brevican core protein-like isoform X2 [Ruditapes philippinarum]